MSRRVVGDFYYSECDTYLTHTGTARRGPVGHTHTGASRHTGDGTGVRSLLCPAPRPRFNTY